MCQFIIMFWSTPNNVQGMFTSSGCCAAAGTKVNPSLGSLQRPQIRSAVVVVVRKCARGSSLNASRVHEFFMFADRLTLEFRLKLWNVDAHRTTRLQAIRKIVGDVKRTEINTNRTHTHITNMAWNNRREQAHPDELESSVYHNFRRLDCVYVRMLCGVENVPLSDYD